MALRAHAFWPLKGLYMPRKMVNFGKDGKVYAKTLIRNFLSSSHSPIVRTSNAWAVQSYDKVEP